MVQKLDVSPSPTQSAELFAALHAKTDIGKVKESTARLEKFRAELKADSKKNPPDRVDAVLAVLEECIARDPNCLDLQGATHYHRSAFESPSGFQFTVDRQQGAYYGSMYRADGSLKNPFETILYNQRLTTGEDTARHTELKFPVHAVLDMLGLQFRNVSTKLPPAPQEFPKEVLAKVLNIYHRHVKSPLHPGKFRFTTKGGQITDYDP